MIKIDKKTEKMINDIISKTLSDNLPSFDFNEDETNLDFICPTCKANYKFDVMAIYFDKLHNKEKFLAHPICPYCGERKHFSLDKNTFHFLSFLYNGGNMKDALLEEPLIKNFLKEYPNENLKDFSKLDEEGLEALEKGDYPEVFRIFTQFIWLNPNHHLGFEFVAYAFYETRDFEKSIYFMEKAVERAEIEAKNNELDKGLYSIINKNLEYMKRRQILFRWWENL